jgi:hypothetical protein
MKEYYVPGIVREVCGYRKIADEDGENFIEVRYDLKPIALGFLQKLFNINPNDPDPATTDLIDCYDINEEQAKKLQPYVVGGFLINLEKYNFYLECYQENTGTDNYKVRYPNAGYYPPPKELFAFPQAMKVEPKTPSSSTSNKKKTRWKMVE